MKTPNFWKDENVISFLLYPLSVVYKFFRTLHVWFSFKYKATNLKVICIGNLTAGGSGKTPLAIKIGQILKEKNIKFAYLSRGYKGAILNFMKVNLSKHTAEEVGDESLLLAEFGDTFISKNRKNAIKIISEDKNYDVIIMDDGFFNPTIFKDKNIIVIDGEYGIGNGELLPSGPLRDTISSVLPQISFVVMMGRDAFNLEEKIIQRNIPVVRACIKVEKIHNDKKYIAFCGLGRNEKFFDSLIDAGYNVIKKYYFEDHHKYSNKDMEMIMEKAFSNKANVITTKKDWVKLSDVDQKTIEYLNMDVMFYNDVEFMELLFK